jgi:multiple sugar transport system permease protein
MRLRALRKKNIEPYLFIMPAALMMLFFLGYSVIYNIGVSFFRWELALPGKSFIGLKNYINILTNDIFGKIVINSITWTVAGVVLQMVIGVSLALIVDNLRGRRSGFMQSVILMPWLIPGVVISLIWMCMLQSDLGVVNYLISALKITNQNILWFSDEKLAMFSVIIVNTWKAVPFWFLIITAALMDLPMDQIESARIDGARYISLFYHVILQHLKPVIVATCTLTTIWTFNNFDIIWVTTKGGPLDATSTLPIYTYRLGFSINNFGQSAAMSVLSFIIVAVVCTPYIRTMFNKIKEG